MLEISPQSLLRSRNKSRDLICIFHRDKYGTVGMVKALEDRPPPDFLV